jgi:hypothetical protein
LNHQKKLWLIDDVLTSCLSLKSPKEAKDKNKPGSLIRELLLPIADTLFQLPPSAFFLTHSHIKYLIKKWAQLVSHVPKTHRRRV